MSVLGQYLPTGQGVHVVAEKPEYVPVGQATAATVFEGVKYPGLLGVQYLFTSTHVSTMKSPLSSSQRHRRREQPCGLHNGSRQDKVNRRHHRQAHSSPRSRCSVWCPESMNSLWITAFSTGWTR